MGRGIYPFLDPPLPTVRFYSDGKAVLEHLAILKDLAAVQGLVPLSTFMDPRCDVTHRKATRFAVSLSLVLAAPPLRPSRSPAAAELEDR